MSQFSAFLDNTFSNQDLKKNMFCFLLGLLRRKKPQNSAASWRQNILICTTACDCYWETFLIYIFNQLTCFNVTIFSPLAQPGEVTNILRCFIMCLIISNVSHSKQEENYQIHFIFYSTIFAWDVTGSCPVTNWLFMAWSRHSSSIFTRPFFHANIAVTFQWAQFCFVRLLSITPDPSRQSLNSSELQPFPQIHCQVAPLNSHTVWHSQQLPQPFQLPFQVWGFWNLLFHKRQLLHLMF